MNPELKDACALERKIFCKDLSADHSRVLGCLTASTGKIGFGEHCAKALRAVKLPIRSSAVDNFKKMDRRYTTETESPEEAPLVSLRIGSVEISGEVFLAALGAVAVVTAVVALRCIPRQGKKGYTVFVPDA